MEEKSQSDSLKKNEGRIKELRRDEEHIALRKTLRGRRQTSYLKSLKEEIKEVCKKHEIEENTFVEMLDELFVDIRKLITSPKMPTVYLQSFGTFKPSKKKISYYLREWIQVFRRFYNSPDELSPERHDKYLKLKDKFRLLWGIKQRFIAEKRGIRTWYCWRDLPEYADGYQDCHVPTPHNCHKCFNR